MISEEIGRIGLIPIAVFEREKDILPTAKALLQADIPVIEITFRTNLAEPAIKKVKQAFPEMLVGAGTILTKEQAYTAVKAGADFIVTPGLKEEVVKVCQEEETLIIPGCVTPSEISRAFELGIRIVKFFPASVYGGIKGCKALSFWQYQICSDRRSWSGKLAGLCKTALYTCGWGRMAL